MKHSKRYLSPRVFVVLMLSLLVVSCTPEGPEISPEASSESLSQFRQDAQDTVIVTQNPLTGSPSFIRGALPTQAGVAPEGLMNDLISRYVGLFGQPELASIGTSTDSLGMRHMTYEQRYQGIEVYGAAITLHLSQDGSQMRALHSSVVPNVSAPETQPTLSTDDALAAVQDSLPGGIQVSSQLVIYPGPRRAAAARLAYLVELRDDAVPARNVYVVDAGNGDVLDVLDRLYTTRDRQTHNANNGLSLPGTLARSEGDTLTGDQDVDNAHDFAGATYDYFFNTHGRDSYDDAGATLISTAHYRTNFANAFWNGVQMVYGDGYPVDDVAAHELTHAVTERTANLEYRWQSGALNESFSDIFGAMVDRTDWLLGEDLPIGAIRDLSNPPAFGDPDHANDWVATCGDNEGVHTNSGIHNKAFFNIATALDKNRAELIFYRALTVYLGVNSSMEDARAAALQAAEDLYGVGSAELQAVEAGFNAVGLDGVWQPPVNNCGGGGSTPDMSVLGLILLALALMGYMLFRGLLAPARP